MCIRDRAKIADEARERWPLLGIEIIHRIGRLEPGEPIVFVGTSSAHRQAAFDACNFIMDYLKTRAPFWKKEDTAEGPRWVEGRCSEMCIRDSASPGYYKKVTEYG